MALRVVGERTHLKITEVMEPKIYSATELRKIRDEDRRIYRKWVIVLVVAQIIIAGSFRIGVENILSKAATNPYWDWLLNYRNHILALMICLIISMWGVGIWATFRRRYK